MAHYKCIEYQALTLTENTLNRQTDRQTASTLELLCNVIFISLNTHRIKYKNQRWWGVNIMLQTCFYTVA